MSVFKRILEIILWIALILAVCALLVVGGAFYYFKTHIAKQLTITDPETGEQTELLGNEELLGIAKHMTDKNFIESLTHFDKETAKLILKTVEEINAENNQKAEQNQSQQGLIGNNPIEKNILEKKVSESVSQNTVEPSVINPDSLGETDMNGAYGRIMNAASKEEIDSGLSIIGKLDMGLISNLRKEGKTDELKSYLVKTLSSAEIQTIITLYNKYSNLL